MMNKRFKNLHTGEMMEVPTKRFFKFHCKSIEMWNLNSMVWMKECGILPGESGSLFLDKEEDGCTWEIEDVKQTL